MIIYALDDIQQHLKIYTVAHGAIGFSSASKLIQAMMEEKPDLFICDLVMPGIDGWTVIHIVRELYPKLPIIVATSRCDFVQKQMADLMKCKFWCKDGNFQALRDLIQEVRTQCTEQAEK